MANLLLLFLLLSSLFASSHGVSPSGMDAKELSALFAVMDSLLDDPRWSELHPHPCSDTPWPGIQCELFQTLDPYLHVTKLHVGPDVASPPCKPTAKLSPSILNLPHLKALSLFNCFLNPNPKNSTILSPSLFTNVSRLEQLVLNSNPGLSCEIPTTLSRLSASLRVLSLSQNNLHGSIPSQLGELGNLQQLDLSYNRLTGAIPEFGAAMSSLTILDLSFNELKSQLPPSLGQLHSLKKLDLSSNNLSGGVPATLGKLGSLVLLDLSRNKLSGPMPEELAGMTELEYLVMEGNPIRTTIPAFVGALSKLAVLGFSGCGFTGAIPSFFGVMDNLTAVSLDKNRLNGSIPKSLGGLPKLGQLNLSQNELSGEIGLSEEFVGRLGRRLDLRDNKGLCADPRVSISVEAPPCLGANSKFGNKPGGEEQGLLSGVVNRFVSWRTVCILGFGSYGVLIGL